MTTDGQSRELDQAPPEAAPDLDRVIVRSVGWLGLSLGARQAINFVVMLILAHRLTPSEFGVLALAGTFLVLMQPIQESGLAGALVYRRHDVEKSAASALVYAPLVSLVLFVCGFVVAPYFAEVFNEPDATSVIRVLLLTLIINSFAVAPAGILERGLNYRARTAGDLASAIAQGVVAITLALTGAGVWSLVAGQIAAAVAGLIVIWLMVPWRPSPRNAEWRVLREMLRYGRWVGASNIVNIVNRSLDNLVVARFLGSSSLGYYGVAFRFADVPGGLLGPILGRAMFPVYSMLQNDVAAVRRVYVQNLQRIALVLLPLTVVLMIETEPIVRVLLGDKWLPVVTPLRILAVWALVRAFVGTAPDVFRGRGKPHLAMYFLVPGTGVLTLLLLLLVPRLDVNGAAAAQALAISIVGLPGLFLAMHLVELRVRRLAAALAPSFFCVALLALTLLVLRHVTESWLGPVMALVVPISVGAVVYVASTAIFARSIVMPIWLGIRPTRDLPA